MIHKLTKIFVIAFFVFASGVSFSGQQDTKKSTPLSAVVKNYYGKPTIFSPSGAGRKENQGYDAFVPLIDSGISAYVWKSSKFTSVLIYSCKKFDARKALKITKGYFKMARCVSQVF